MTKIKRIDYIANGKGVVKDRVDFRKKKVERTVEDAISEAEENIYECENKAKEIINEISKVADKKEDISAKINQYIDQMQNADGWRDTKKYLEKLHDILDEEVEIDDAVQEVKLVQ